MTNEIEISNTKEKVLDVLRESVLSYDEKLDVMFQARHTIETEHRKAEVERKGAIK